VLDNVLLAVQHHQPAIGFDACDVAGPVPVAIERGGSLRQVVQIADENAVAAQLELAGFADAVLDRGQRDAGRSDVVVVTLREGRRFRRQGRRAPRKT
jgi:hypothetical protein